MPFKITKEQGLAYVQHQYKLMGKSKTLAGTIRKHHLSKYSKQTSIVTKLQNLALKEASHRKSSQSTKKMPVKMNLPMNVSVKMLILMIFVVPTIN